MEKIKSLLIKPGISIKQAWKQLNDNGHKILFVINESGRLAGSVTDGDIRRLVLEDRSLLDPIDQAMCETPVTAGEMEGKEEIKKKLFKHRIHCIPVINNNQEIKKVIFWDELFNSEEINSVDQINVPVVIMAGGRGIRLDPFTKILPKPLMPIGDKPFIEIVLEKFENYGIKDFFLSLNYKSNMIKAYFQDCSHNFNIHYILEKTPLGTAGSLSLLEDKISSTFIVSNGDIQVDTNYADLLRFHRENKNKISLVCSMRHVPVPYGVVEIENGGALKGIREKPELDQLVLTGLYLVEPEMIRLIPKDKEFHMTHLIEKMRAENQKIGVYPVSEKSWIDIGELESYQKVLRRFQ